MRLNTKIPFRVLLLTALLTVGPATLAQDKPPPPEDVFRFAIFDAGDALEIDWAVEDGAYMYRDSFRFASGSAAVRLGAPELPDGEIHTDEFFGEQVVYRGNFFVRLPYTIAGDKPASFPLTIESRGCLDSGFCYVPQTWIETVALEAPVSPATADALLDAANEGPASGVSSLGSSSEFPPPEEVFFPDAFAVDGNTVEVGFRIIPGYYLYRDKISVTVLTEGVRGTRFQLPQGKIHSDEFFGEQEVYYDEVVGRLALARDSTDPLELELEVGYQGCADAGLCYVPLTDTVTVQLPATSVIADLSSLSAGGNPLSDPAGGKGAVTTTGATPSGTGVDVQVAPVSEQARLAKVITESSLWVAAGVFFVAGLALALTPCVLPMVPILSGIIAGEGDNVSSMRGFTLALSYVLGMALVYTAAGVAAAAAGLQLQAMFNQPWVLVLFAALFVALALGMFGLYDLQMPSGIQSRLATVSGNQKSGTMIGAFVMGALSALVVTACVAPALIAALTVMAQTGDMLRGGVALFAMSLGMGAPLLLVGAAQGKFLPKAGAWMVAVKVAFGFMFIGLAIWMLSRILPGQVTMILWSVLILISGVFLGGMTTLDRGAPVAQKLGKGFGLLAIFYGLVLFFGALAGGTNPLKPLASVSLGDGAAAPERHLEFTRIKTGADLDREIAVAAAAGKSVMLDFYADWCVSCIEMEEYTFIKPDVQAALANTVTLQADVTRNDADDQALLARFGVFGPPTIVFFGADGKQRKGYEVVGFMDAEDFASHVRQAVPF